MNGRTNAAGIVLPALTNPAAAGNIQSGYQAINGEGEVVTGTADVRETVLVQIINNTHSFFYFGYTTTHGAPTTTQIINSTAVNALSKSIIYISSISESRSINVSFSDGASLLLNWDAIRVLGLDSSPVTITIDA